MVKHFWAGICLGAAAVYAAPAVSQTESGGTAGPDKSGYTVFNPTPVEQMRGFCTDRPTKSNLPCTVDAGHFQYEADAINWTYAKAGGVQTNTYLYTNPTLKLGLTNTIDAELNIAPAERIFSNSAAGKSSIGGAGDLFLRTKLNIAGPEGGDFQLTALPFIKVPTAKPGIGNSRRGRLYRAGLICLAPRLHVALRPGDRRFAQRAEPRAPRQFPDPC
jgi:Putative MetA-pathway of phenol degradation